MKAVQARVSGRVQGVSFRWYTQERARQLGVTGWVRNDPDGSVLVHAEGEDDAVELAAGTTLRLVETRLIEGIDVHLVVEVADGDAEPESVLVELAAAARAALEAGGGPSYTSDRFVGDIG